MRSVRRAFVPLCLCDEFEEFILQSGLLDKASVVGACVRARLSRVQTSLMQLKPAAVRKATTPSAFCAPLRRRIRVAATTR